jgi:RecB family exonuclease
VVIAPDAVEEVRSAVREAIAAMERDPPVPLHRQAIVYRDADVYGPLLRDTVAAAGLPFASLDGRPLADTVPARALLNLLRLREADFSRAAVLGWLSGLPGSGGVLRNQARWDKLSRDAGVIRGAVQWGDRLDALATETARRRDEWLRDDADESSGRIRAMERDIEECRAIADHIRALAELTAPPAERTWPAHVAWIHRLRDEVLTPDRAWSDADRESSQRVGEIVDALGAAADVEPDVDVSVVLRALEDALRAQRRPEGRFGGGIVIGPHDALSGIDLDRVHILGVVEGTFPAAMRPDPLLPGDPLDLRSEHEAGDRRAWRMALEAAGGGGETVVSAPMVDVEGRAAFPSPWLLRVLDEDGRRPAATEVRSGRAAHERLRHTGSELAATYTQPPLSLAERREREALRAYLARIDVARIGLARRDDLPLGRALELTRARGSAGLTDFDGNLISIAPASALLQPGLEGRTQSATGVEQWATCPFRFLLGRILWVSATDDADDERWWQIDAAEKGTLIHRILERFFAGVIAAGEPPPGAAYTPAQHARLRAIALEEFAAAETRGVTGHPLVWANERNTILSDLRFLLDVDTERRAAGGWTPAHVEQSFGGERDGSWPAVEVPIGQGRAIRFRGYIDRVDTAPGLARVIDYKSGSTKASAFSVANRLDAGRRLQLPVYAEAVRQQARHAGATPPATIALYWYATAKANFDVREITVTPEVERVLAEVLTTIDAGVRGGCFPQVPGDWNDHAARCDNCRYCDYDTVCPAGREVLAATKRESGGTLLHRELAADDAGTDAVAEEGDE